MRPPFTTRAVVRATALRCAATACAVPALAAAQAAPARAPRAAAAPVVAPAPANLARGPRVPALDPADTTADVAADAPVRRPVPVVRSPAGGGVPAPPPTPAAVSRRNPTLTARERRAVGLSRQWISNRDMPTVGAEGSVVFTFGATLPSIVCAPLYVCDLALQPGEVVNDINIGDKVRWEVTPATSGAGALTVTHVVIKPKDAGLRTNVILTTDRRTYVLNLVSRTSDWMPRVSFVYPDEASAQWVAYRAQQEAERARVRAATVLPTGENAGAAVAALDFDFRLAGDAPRWRPLRVYADGAKTYIQFPPAVASGEAPALVALGPDGKEQLVNYRMVGDRYVADRVLERALLVTGVGRQQQRVEVVREARAGSRASGR